MSATVPPRGNDQQRTSSSALTPGAALESEDALKRLFFAEYTALTAEAHTALGDAASPLATKVVEGAFVRAWDARATFLTQEQLDKFLIDDVHHAAARALSRRAAAHRFAGHAAPEAHHTIKAPTAEESWGHVQHALHGEEHSPGTLAAVAKASRHEAAEHIGGIAKGGNMWIAMLVGAVVIAGVAGAVMMMNRAAAKEKEFRAVNSTEVREVASPSGRTGDVQLTDGSTAHMAPGTKLTIPTEFGPELRGVKVQGAVSIDVAPGLPRALHVFARDVDVVATGTSFTVSAYPSDSGVTVVVGEGSVEVRRGLEAQTVAAGAGLVVRDGAPMRPATEQEREDAAGWRTGTLAITNKPLRNALELMQRWYNFDIKLPDTSLYSRPVTLKVSIDSSMQAIAAVEKSAGMKFGYMGPNMVLRDTADKRTR